MRLIDGDALLETSIRITGHFDLPGGKVQNFEAISVKAIESAPTIDPVKRGKWTMDTDPDDGDCRCSCCRACIDALHKRNHDIIKALGFELNTFYRYCPSCGARMDGEPK